MQEYQIINCKCVCLINVGVFFNYTTMYRNDQLLCPNFQRNLFVCSSMSGMSSSGSLSSVKSLA